MGLPPGYDPDEVGVAPMPFGVTPAAHGPGALLVTGGRLRRDGREVVGVRLARDEGRLVAGVDIEVRQIDVRVSLLQLLHLTESGLDEVDRKGE